MSTRRTVRIVGFVFKTLFSLLILGVCAILLWRIFFSMNEPDGVSTLYVNQPLKEAYKEHGEDLVLKYQNQFSMTYSEENAGYFGVSQYVIIPEADQIQVVLRFNNATLTHIKEDFGLAEAPKKGDPELLDLSLRHITDLTPDNTGDNEELSSLDIKRIQPSYVTVDTTALYTYYRIVFDGVSINESAVSNVVLDIYYNDTVDYNEKAYGSLLLYDNLADWFDYDLTRADKKALEDAVK